LAQPALARTVLSGLPPRRVVRAFTILGRAAQTQSAAAVIVRDAIAADPAQLVAESIS
jgi:hypothetical protein